MNRADFEWANASRVTEHLWVGGDLETTNPVLALKQLDELHASGLTDIVDLRLEWDDAGWVTVAKPHLRYHWLGVDDAGQRMPDKWFDTGTELIRAALADGGKALVHCHMGINRGPSMGFAAMLTLGWDPIEALDRIRKARPIAHVGYAKDALDWWCSRNAVSVAERHQTQARVQDWRSENHLDVAKVIRRIRIKEGV